MKACFDAETLKSAHAHAASILKGDGRVFMEVDGEATFFSQTDGVSCNAKCVALNAIPGRCFLPADKLGTVLKHAKGVVEVYDKGNSIYVKVGRDQHRFQTENPDDSFPRFAHDYSRPKIRISGDDLKTLIDRTVHLCQDSTLYATGGCLVSREGTNVAFTSLASAGLAKQTVAILDDSDGHDIGRPVIPAAFLKSARPMAKADIVGISFSQNDVLFEADNMSIKGALLPQRFPDVNLMVQRMGEVGESLIVDPKEFRESVETSLIASSKETKAVKLLFDDSFIKLSHASETGESESYCPAAGVSRGSIHVDGFFLISLLKDLVQETAVCRTVSDTHLILKSESFFGTLARITVG